MQKKRVVLILIAIFLVLAGIGGTKKVVEMRQEAQKERQVAFLKAHEKEMTEYVKKQDEKISRVTFIWNTVKQEEIGNGLPQGAGKILTMRIKIFDNKGVEINAFGFAVKPDDINKPTKINEMYTINANYNYFKKK
ncbi:MULTISPECIES: hypothetical protein [Ligilactobacillus]|jgi:hypothetical protein|uniref:hypothetical protein n=1 Tax=Ligilactobacillus TaxID=2767887 RepID=UPI00259AC744|nr:MULTISPECIES: hypothetical protein [Ligilactobacillus]WOY90080.1 hypothetical protein R7892_05040 [Ligilactobacillus murinus]